MSTDNMHCLL